MNLEENLKQLVDNSPVISDLPEAEREDLINRILSASPDQMTELIKIFEGAQAEFESISQEIVDLESEIKGLNAEVKNLETVLGKKIIKAEEIVSQKNDDEKAEDLLKRLEEIV
jgi:predicted  nucleic acid-binding Zn-ribbon protein